MNQPDSFRAEAGLMANETRIPADPYSTENCASILAFISRQQEVDTLAPLLVSRLGKNGILWFACPKQSSRNYTCDFYRDTGWEIMNIPGVGACAWSPPTKTGLLPVSETPVKQGNQTDRLPKTCCSG